MIAWGLETLLATSLLMLAVLVLRNPVRHAFGPAVAYAMWALPALRLVLPPLPGDWQLSGLIAPLFEHDETARIAFRMLPPDQAPTQIAQQAVATMVLDLADTPARSAILPPVAAADGASWLMIAIAVWIVGAVAFLGYHLITYRRFCARLERGTRRRYRIAGGRVEIIETDATGGPLAFGIWRKFVAFPSDFADRYDRDEQALALAHELTHHERGDLIANWVALVVLALNWFSPIAWRAFRSFRADQEMACDARVLAGKDAAVVHAYGRAIVRSAHGGAISAACHLHTINELKGRLRMLSIGKKSRGRIVAGSIGVAAMTLVGLGVTASGTAAAERLRAKVGTTIGVDLNAVDAVDAAAPVAPPAPTWTPQAKAPAAPVAPVAPVALPPSSAAQADLPTPPTPPAPPAPEAPGKIKRKVIVLDGNGSDGAPKLRRRVVIVNSSGDDVAETVGGLPGAFEVTELKCKPGQGDAHQMVLHDEKQGKHRMVICTNRIELLAESAAGKAARAQSYALDAREIERNAYRSALAGLRGARAAMTASGRGSEALKAIDEAIAEVESDLAKVN